MTLKNRGRSKKTEGRTRPKSKGGSLAVGTYLQRGSAPPGRKTARGTGRAGGKAGMEGTALLKLTAIGTSKLRGVSKL